ncbi:MAG: 50S ribosomal protein L6 [Candidatus Omnitrophota bacterium]
MSRIGKKIITVPAGVKVKIDGGKVFVEGPKGKLEQVIHPRVEVTLKDGAITVARHTDIGADRALHGLVRSLIVNMIQGVTQGYQKELLLEGVGYKAQVKGKALTLNLGFTHPIDYEIPQGVEIKCANPTAITVSGADKQKVGQAAAEIRRFHKPEPYKGKGIRYVDEHVRRKQGKTVG